MESIHVYYCYSTEIFEGIIRMRFTLLEISAPRNDMLGNPVDRWDNQTTKEYCYHSLAPWQINHQD